MKRCQVQRSMATWLAATGGLAAAVYAARVAVTWYRYGKPFRGGPDERDGRLDRFMPVFDGPQLAAKILERHPGTCIILCSGFQTEAPDTGQPGALYDAIVDKPVHMSELSQIIVRVLESRRSH